MSRWLFALVALPAFAHVVSMSTGDAVLNGARLDYVLRMPLFEVTHLSQPEKQLFDNIHFRGAGSEARLLEHSCQPDSVNFVCHGVYLFEHETGGFEVECNFAAVTVPNHVHLLRATNGARSDQAAFDASFTTASVRFRPPTALETALRDGAAGFWRATAALILILFLAALVLAARSRRELVLISAAFLSAQALSASAHLASRASLSPRFIEAATALTIAYLAVEILLLPAAGKRWTVAGILGLLHGMYFDLLLSAGDYSAPSFLAGVLTAEVLLLAAFAAAAHFAGALKVQRVMASVLLLIGLSWFVIRLRG